MPKEDWNYNFQAVRIRTSPVNYKIKLQQLAEKYGLSMSATLEKIIDEAIDITEK